MNSREQVRLYISWGAVVVVSSLVLVLVFRLTNIRSANAQRAGGQLSSTAAAGAAPAPPPAATALQPQQTIISGGQGESASATPHAGTMRIVEGSGLSGKFSYWFVSPENQASKVKSLPAPAANGLITLEVPVQYNRSGAQMRVLDTSQGKIASLPVIDFGRQSVVVRQQVGPNLLQNADFTGNLNSWNVEMTPPASAKTQVLDGLGAPPGVAGNVVRFDVQALGSQDWHVQCYQKGIDLTDGQQYLLSFWAKADQKRTIRADTTLDHPDYHKVGLDATFKLTPRWLKYEVIFRAVHTEPGHTHLSFALGSTVGTVELAGVTLRSVTGADVVQPASSTSAVTLSATDFK